MNNYLKEKWKKLVRQRDDDTKSTLSECDILFYELIVKRYSEPWRKYHTLNHIESCFKYFDELVPSFWLHDIRKSIDLQLAIFFHDLIYYPKCNSNEADSAYVMTAQCERIGFNSHCIGRVEDMIMATMHTGSVADKSFLGYQYLVDIDLTILGEAQKIFDDYDYQISQEYDWLPDDVYKLGRIRVLQGFLDRERIYTTDPFFDKFELQARRNLRRTIDRLNKECY